MSMSAYKVTLEFLVMAEDEHMAIVRLGQYVADPHIQSVQNISRNPEIKCVDVNAVLHSEGPF